MTGIILNLILLLLFPFLFLGIINRTKAFWAGRQGASVLQPFYDFIRLLNKGEVISRTTSFIFTTAPSLSFATILFAGLLVPLFNNNAFISFEGDFILFAYILALGKFFSLIGALDTGSSFEGMGASREAGFSTIVEPAFFITIASIAALNGIYSFDSLSLILQNSGELGGLMLILVSVVMFMMILIEGCRVPFDDPNTHLELTMVHEVMVLDNSGVDLALINYGNSMKMVIFTALIANIIHPAAYLIVPILIGTVESSIARFRMTRLFEFIFLMSSISLVILALVMIVLYGNHVGLIQ